MTRPTVICHMITSIDGRLLADRGPARNSTCSTSTTLRRSDLGSSWAVVLPGLFVAGVSNGILNASLGHEAVQTVPQARTAMGSAANKTARYLGLVLGISLISLLIAGARGEGFFDGWHLAVVASSATSLLGVLAMVLLSRGGRGGALPA